MCTLGPGTCTRAHTHSCAHTHTDARARDPLVHRHRARGWPCTRTRAHAHTLGHAQHSRTLGSHAGHLCTLSSCTNGAPPGLVHTPDLCAHSTCATSLCTLSPASPTLTALVLSHPCSHAHCASCTLTVPFTRSLCRSHAHCASCTLTMPTCTLTVLLTRSPCCSHAPMPLAHSRCHLHAHSATYTLTVPTCTLTRPTHTLTRPTCTLTVPLARSQCLLHTCARRCGRPRGAGGG